MQMGEPNDFINIGFGRINSCDALLDSKCVHCTMKLNRIQYIYIRQVKTIEIIKDHLI